MLRLAMAILFSITATMAHGVDLNSNVLKPCPDKPNCISTAEVAAKHGLEPLPFRGNLQQTREALVQLISTMPNSAIVQTQDKYIHVTFTSKMFGFVDDVEFLLDETNHLTHIRSASRSGYYDFGVNKRRVEDIVAQWGRGGVK